MSWPSFFPAATAATAAAPAAPSLTTRLGDPITNAIKLIHTRVVTAIENYGRVYRLLKANVPVSIEMNVDVKFSGDHEHGFDTIAEIPAPIQAER